MHGEVHFPEAVHRGLGDEDWHVLAAAKAPAMLGGLEEPAAVGLGLDDEVVLVVAHLAVAVDPSVAVDADVHVSSPSVQIPAALTCSLPELELPAKSLAASATLWPSALQASAAWPMSKGCSSSTTAVLQL